MCLQCVVQYMVGCLWWQFAIWHPFDECQRWSNHLHDFSSRQATENIVRTPLNGVQPWDIGSMMEIIKAEEKKEEKTYPAQNANLSTKSSLLRVKKIYKNVTRYGAVLVCRKYAWKL